MRNFKRLNRTAVVGILQEGDKVISEVVIFRHLLLKVATKVNRYIVGTNKGGTRPLGRYLHLGTVSCNLVLMLLLVPTKGLKRS